jgi:hypothetical protein
MKLRIYVVELGRKVGLRVRRLRVGERAAQRAKYAFWVANFWVTRDPRVLIVEKYFWKNFSFLDFWHRWWKISRRYFAGEICVAVSAVTKGLVGGMAAAAEPDGGASGKAEFISGEIDDFKIAFD